MMRTGRWAGPVASLPEPSLYLTINVVDQWKDRYIDNDNDIYIWGIYIMKYYINFEFNSTY